MNEADTSLKATPTDSLSRFRRWGAIAVAVAVLGYVGYALLRGFSDTATEITEFRWAFCVPVLALTLVNYGLRYAKWTYLLGRVGVRLPQKTNLAIFGSGLAMVITPGKAGELLKPYLVRVACGAPMTRTIPVLVTERATDGIAVVILAALGVGTYYADGAGLIGWTLVAVAVGLVIVMIRPLATALIDFLRRVKSARGVADRLANAYDALRTCVDPPSLAITLAMSLVAWWAECVGFWLIWKGLDVNATLDASTFLYAFATVFGAPSPGGMGMADAALVEGALAVLPGLSGGQAVAGALLVRLATLWFGVVLGALVLLRMDSVIATTPPPTRAPNSSVP